MANAANEQVDWVSLDDVMAAADRGLAPIGPELAGFVVLETAQRLRELGGVLEASLLALGTSGHVALTAPPRRGDEPMAVEHLRQMLASFLAVATSSTPALRQCARRRDHNTLAALCRELEGALIPLNRAASRRAVARVARATVEAIDSGRMEPGATVEREPSPPAIEVATRKSTPPPLPSREVTPEPVEIDDEPTPFTAQTFDHEPTPLEELSAHTETASPPQIEIVSQLPPIVAETDDSQRFAVALDLKRIDRVSELIESFEVSRRRDDPALSRDLKAMVGIETSVPPAVSVNVRLRPRTDDITIDHDVPREPTVIINDEAPPAPRKRRSGFLAFFAVVTIACGVAALAAKPAALDAILGPPLPPPGDTAIAQPAAAPLAPAPRIPIVCEASLTLENAPSGAEVLRRIGVTPLTVPMPMHVGFDLVATMDGHTPRRAHIDASAIWQQESTGARIDVPFALDAVQGQVEAKWPAATGVVPLRAHADAPRGLMRATSTPNGAAIWLVVDPSAVTSVPCGGAVELMLVREGKAPKKMSIDWAQFSGSPPRAVAKL
jgi:hypothetical protein